MTVAQQDAEPISATDGQRRQDGDGQSDMQDVIILATTAVLGLGSMPGSHGRFGQCTADERRRHVDNTQLNE